MNRILWSLMLCLVASTATASSARFGDRLVSSGDTAGKVTQVAGKPDRVVQLENRFGANTGERWEYYQARKTIHVIFEDGKVTDVRELFN